MHILCARIYICIYYIHPIYLCIQYIRTYTYTYIYIYEIQLVLPAGLLTNLVGFLFSTSFTDTHSCTELLSAQAGHMQKIAIS